jgi:putative FmdB family regulatory protein
MPIYEYQCRKCENRFEAIVRVQDDPPSACPACQSSDIERLISLFAVDSGDTRKMALDAARRQNAKTTKEKAHAEAEYERKHHH